MVRYVHSGDGGRERRRRVTAGISHWYSPLHSIASPVKESQQESGTEGQLEVHHTYKTQYRHHYSMTSPQAPSPSPKHRLITSLGKAKKIQATIVLCGIFSLMPFDCIYFSVGQHENSTASFTNILSSWL